jgi:FAD/FMN-containing dehydrogenase
VAGIRGDADPARERASVLWRSRYRDLASTQSRRDREVAEVDQGQRFDVGVDGKIDSETGVGEADVDLRPLEHQPVVGVRRQAPESEMNDDALRGQVLDADAALDHPHQEGGIEVGLGQVARNPLVRPRAEGTDDRVEFLAGLGQAVLVAVSIGHRPSLDYACALERVQPLCEKAARDPRQSAQELVEMSGSAEELADDEWRPALSEELGPSRDGAELPVSPHEQRVPQLGLRDKSEIWTCGSDGGLARSAVMAGDLNRLRQAIEGEVIRPGDPPYDQARKVWNGAIDRRPAVIVRCAGVSDVVAAVRFSRERDVVVSLRGGGHGVGGHAVCEGGLVIDLSPMKAINVEPSRRTARAEAGVLWGELDLETQEFGLATTGGVVTHTGIAGLTLGGGIGWLMRKHGTTVDNLLSAQVVTVEGDMVTVSAEEHADLFWAIRGGGGNFGIVTSFEYRLHPVGPQVAAGPIFHSLEDAPELLRFYRDFIVDTPEELTTIFNLRRAPSLPLLPPELHGRLVAMVAVCYAGPVEEGEVVLRPLRAFGSPLVDAIGARPYTELQSMFDATVPHGWRYYWKSSELPPLSDGAIETLVEHAAAQTSPLSYCITFQLGGAVSRVGEEETAFSQRDAAHNVNINAVWMEDDEEPERHVEWTRRFHAALEPFACDRVYVNFLGEEGAERVRSAYGDEKYQRLARLKGKWDPSNFLRHNQNIEPRAARGTRGR